MYKKMYKKMYKRMFLLNMMFAVAVALCLWQPPQASSADTLIVVGEMTRSTSNAIAKLVPQFEEQTGIKVRFEQYPFSALCEKMMLESEAHTGYFDAVYMSPSVLGAMVEAGHLVRLDEYIEKYDVDMDDFMDVSLEMAQYPGHPGHWFIPNLLTVRILAYRKDLFEDRAERSAFKQKYGYELDPPETTSELLDIAEFFTRDTTGDGKIDMYGYAFPQKPDVWSWEYAVHLIWTFGGDVIDKAFKVGINSPWSIKGFEFGKQLQKYQPPGVLGWNVEHIDLFKQGKVTMIAVWHEKADLLNDPELSPLAGKVGYCVLPKYEKNPWSYTAGRNRVGGGGLAVMKDSKNKEAAFRFIKWQTSKELALPLYREGGNLVRKSAYELKEIMALRPWLAELFPVVKESLLESAVHRPSIPEAYAMQIEIANAWQRFIMGEATAEEALKHAHDTIHRMLEKAGYYD